jgi:ribosomal protein S18 acetylase RimI-like enzyme
VQVTSRIATVDDIDIVIAMYRDLSDEQEALRPLWPLADGLAEPATAELEGILGDEDSLLLVGEIDGYPLGFLWARVEPLLPQADGEDVGVIRLIFTDPEARGVGVGDVMITQALAELRARGLRYFDARVSPGHRNAKNFFESNGFSARLIVMHHADN